MNETEIQYRLNLNAYLSKLITLAEYDRRAELIAEGEILY